MGAVMKMASAARITTEYQLVTPEMALDWLENFNTANRHVRQSRVEQFAAEMRAGTWRLTHQGIAFGADGKLYDGQHRLWAVVESQKTVMMAVTRGLAEEARTEIDTCSRRTVGDNFAILTGMANSKRVVEAAGVVRMLVTGFTTGRSNGGDTYAAVEEYVEKYRAGLEWAAAMPQMRQIGNSSVRGALAFAHKTDTAKVEEFAAQMWEGASLLAASPAFVLRRYLIARRSYSKNDRRELAVKTLRACAAHLGGELIHSGKIWGTEDATAYFGVAHGLKLTSGSADGIGQFLRRIKAKKA